MKRAVSAIILGSRFPVWGTKPKPGGRLAWKPVPPGVHFVLLNCDVVILFSIGVILPNVSLNIP